MPLSEIGRPYFIVPDVELYKTLDPASDEAKELSRKIAVNMGDTASLRHVLGIDPPEFNRFYPEDGSSSQSSFDTIDSFLDKFGGNIPVGGYMAQEMSEEKGKEEETIKENTPEINDEKEELTFKYLIKHHRYQEALMLIERQNLNNTEKSIYFAHQMRFIKKLIALDNFRNKTRD